jgi:tetratricopeptide (TPR) repeat protein
MVFDIRGKRRHVVKVVYAILALLMGASLFLVVGPLNIGELIGTSSSTSSAAKPFEEQAERIELKLKKSPEDADLLAALTRARINAGNSSVAVNSEGRQVITTEAVQQYQLASEAWSRYVKATDEPSVGVAQVAAPTFVTLAEASGIGELEANLGAAVEAQQIVADARPSVGTLTNLAIYQYFAFDYKQAHKTEAKALALAEDKFQRESIENQLQEYEKRAKELQKQLKSAEQAAQSAGGGSEGGASLENPLNSLGGASLGE